jgi:imidazolonepropionase-like amidohydrolase
MRPSRIFQIVLVMIVLPAFVSTTQAQTIAIKAGKLIDPETATVATDQVILVEGKTIKAVGPDVRIPAEAEVIDLTDATVLPGLVESHTHMLLTMDEEQHGSYYVTTLVNTTAYRAIEGVANARSMLESGFTTIRDLGNNANYGDVDLKRAIDAGVVPGPTMVTSGRIIAPFGGQLQLQPERPDLAEPEYFFADTKDELRKAIRENIHYGATVIKIVVDDQKYIYSVDDIRFVVDESRKAGMKVAAHCVTEKGFHNAAAAGVHSIEHGFVATDEDLELAKQQGVVLVGTDLTDLIAELWGFDDVPAVRRQVIDRTQRAYRIGVTMAYGSDIFFSRPDQTRGELCLSVLDTYVEAGLPADTILKMITVNGIRLLGLENERGRVAAGLAADIIATAKNPLDDILALKHVHFVMKNGKVFKQSKTAR